MANIPLKTVKFPGLSDTYTIPQVDSTLAVTGAAADAKAAGDAIDEVNERIDNMEPGLSDDAKVALLDCFAHVAWVDEHGQDYYDALEQALYAGVQYLTVSFTPGDDIFFTDDSLDILKDDLVVTLHDGSQSTIIQPSDYSLAGNLVAGANTVTVIYGTLNTTFNMTAIENIASSLSNIYHPSASASGTYIVNDGVLRVTCPSQSAVDGYWTWIIDSKGTTYWNDVIGKTVVSRIKAKRAGTSDVNGKLLNVFALASVAEPTSASSQTRRSPSMQITPTTEYQYYTNTVVAQLENFTAGSITPDSNTKFGILIFDRTLDPIDFAEIKMGVL